MNTRTIVLTCLLLSAAPLLARSKTDQLVMRNGDRITCEIKGLDAGVLYVSVDYMDGTSSVDWSKVARVESNQLFVVKTEDGLVYTGRLSTAEEAVGRPVKIQVVEGSEQLAEIDRSQVVGMVATSDKFWERFNGSVSFGVIYAKGNQTAQYSLGSETTYVRERWSARGAFDSNLSTSSGANASTRNALSISALRLLPSKNWFYSGIGDFLQSSEQGIDLQRTIGGGIGRYIVNTNRTSFAVLGGAAWQATDYKQSIAPISTQNLAAAMFYIDAKLFKFSKTDLDITAVLLPALSDPGRVRFNTNASYYIKIISDLKWNVTFYGNWDNRPPAGFSGSDYGMSSGLTWTFGLK
jgi:Protein of unknown function, DUF481